MRGLRWVDSEMRWVKVFSWNTFLTGAICRAWWRVCFETYRGAWAMRRWSLDWCLWRTDILVGEAEPTVQCRRSIQALESLCRWALCWSVTTGNVSLWSGTIPSLEGEVLSCCCSTVLPSEWLIQMYPEVSDWVRWGILLWLKYRQGEFPRRSVNVTCVDFVSFIFSLHFRVQFSMPRRLVCRFAVAVMGLVWHERMAVSSVKVLRVVDLALGMSAVYRV